MWTWRPAGQCHEEVAISVALTGGFFMTRHNPAQPISEQEIMEAGRACMRTGASALHIHVRNEMELSILDLKRFVTIIEPLETNSRTCTSRRERLRSAPTTGTR